MPSSMLHREIPFLVYTRTNLLLMLPLVLCFWQKFQLSLDNLIVMFIKCVIVGYFRTQKEYPCIDPMQRKYYFFDDVINFQFAPFFLLMLKFIYLPFLSINWYQLLQYNMYRHLLNLLKCIPDVLEIQIGGSYFFSN